MSQHTKGPWKYQGFRVYYGDVDGGLERTVADCNLTRIRQRAHLMPGEFQEAEANARLIAAAPDLLEACKAMFDDIGYTCDRDGCECGDFDEHGKCCHTQAMAAIAKAEGKPAGKARVALPPTLRAAAAEEVTCDLLEFVKHWRDVIDGAKAEGWAREFDAEAKAEGR
jgi:hypothetical protein